MYVCVFGVGAGWLVAMYATEQHDVSMSINYSECQAPTCARGDPFGPQWMHEHNFHNAQARKISSHWLCDGAECKAYYMIASPSLHWQQSISHFNIVCIVYGCWYSCSCYKLRRRPMMHMSIAATHFTPHRRTYFVITVNIEMLAIWGMYGCTFNIIVSVLYMRADGPMGLMIVP